MANPKPTSGKHFALMTSALHRIYNASFDEEDIRFLLLAMRSNAQFLTKNFKVTNKQSQIFYDAARQLADIADSVAHPELKDRGPIRDYVRSADTQHAKAYSKNEPKFTLDVANNNILLNPLPNVKTLSGYWLVATFLTGLKFLFPFDLEDHKLHLAAKDIELCLFSIVHHIQLPDLDGEDSPRHAYLALGVGGDSYAVFTGVINSETGKVLFPNPPPHRPSYVHTFQVFQGGCPIGDGIQPNPHRPKPLFARRSLKGNLVLEEWKNPMDDCPPGSADFSFSRNFGF